MGGGRMKIGSEVEGAVSYKTLVIDKGGFSEGFTSICAISS